jgi:uncharacterized membrane protein YdbT with pleckstrin-like domain
MSYIDSHLLPGETVTYRTRLHWKVDIVPALFTLVICVPLVVLALNSTSTPHWLAALPAVGALVSWIRPWLERRSSEFAVTNRRVIIKLGFFSTRSVELLLSKIEGIAVTQSLLGRMLGFGEIVVTGSGGTQERFDHIQAPLEFRQAVQAATGQ